MLTLRSAFRTTCTMALPAVAGFGSGLSIYYLCRLYGIEEKKSLIYGVQAGASVALLAFVGIRAYFRPREQIEEEARFILREVVSGEESRTSYIALSTLGAPSAAPAA